MNNLKTNPQRTDTLINELTLLWEDSVRETHLFLSEDDITKLIPFVKLGLNAIETLIIYQTSNTPIAFIGVENKKIEMLFVSPKYFRKGIGQKLITLAREKYNALYVDVNEQNPSATEFYKKLGFSVFERSETDEQGNPFPILKMHYGNNTRLH